MKRVGERLASFVKDGPGETHPLAIAAISLAVVFPIIGFVVAFIARTQIAFSEGKYSGDKLAFGAMIIAPVMQFSTLIFGAAWVLVVFGLNL